jgi:hypothetical protein
MERFDTGGEHGIEPSTTGGGAERSHPKCLLQMQCLPPRWRARRAGSIVAGTRGFSAGKKIRDSHVPNLSGLGQKSG